MTITNSASTMPSEPQLADQAATKSAIQSAITLNNRIFWVYVGVVLVGAILTVLLFNSGNRVQEAIKADADARLKSSEERIAVLTVEADKAKGEIAKAQADAAKANERTGALELEKDKQRERTAIAETKLAKAETELLRLQESLKPRRLTLEQMTSLLKDLSSGEKGEIQINFVSGNLEAENFATDIAKVLHATGWTVGAIGSVVFLGETPVGVGMIVHDPQTPRVSSLVSAFEHVGISVPVKINPKANPPVQLNVGHKP